MASSDKAQQAAAAADVTLAYRVILGRDPESQAVIAAAVGQPVAAMVSGLLLSGEFDQGVVRPLMEARPPAERFPGLPTPDDRLWACTRLALTPEGAEALQAAAGWPEFLHDLYADPAFGPTVDALEPDWSRAALVEGLDAWRRTPPDAGTRETDWGDSIAERDAAMKRDISERLVLGPAIPHRRVDGPLISILTPLYNSPLEHLATAVESVRRQSYPKWELILVDDGSPKPTVRALAEAFAALDPRVRVRVLERNVGIAAASNAGLEAARGEFLALLDHDDMLTADALEQVVRALDGAADADLLYSDECLIDEHGLPKKIFAKPDWSPLLMLGMHYIGHLTVYRTRRVRELGGFRSEFDFSQDYDLALRVMEQRPRVVHIDRVLYGWRMVEGSAAAGGKDFARATNVAALQDALDRRGWEGFAEAPPRSNRVRRRPRPLPRVAIVVPSDDAGNIAASVRSIRARTWYADYEIRVVTSSPLAARLRREPGLSGVVWVPYDRPFNFSDKCNAGAREADADLLVFYNDDVRVVTPDWIEALVEVATLPGVGAVGPKLLYEDGAIQHAGMVTGVRRLVGTAFHTRPADTHDWFNLGQAVRETSLLCGALLMIRRDLFDRLDGFDAVAAPVAHSDVDLCLRVREQGVSCVYTPHATLTHIGHQTLGAAEAAASPAARARKDKADIHLLRRFPEAIAYDPFYPPAARGLDHLDSQTRFALHPADVAGASDPDSDSGDALIVTGELSATGGPKVVLDMVRVLRAAGRFVVVASARDGVMRPRLTAEGAQVIVDSRLLAADAWVRDFGRNFDLVIANTAVTWPVVAALGPETDVRWYFHEVDLVARLARDRPGFVPALSLAREVWTGSPLGREALDRLGARALVLPYGVDDRGRLPPPDGALVRVGVFGTFERRKGQDLALAAWRRLPPELREGAELRFWGRVLEDDFHADLLAGAATEPGVVVEGELAHDAYLDALASCDIVLAPSRDDTLPLVTLDALSAGRVLVCSRRVGTAAHVASGVSAFVAAAPEPELLAAALAPPLADAALRERVGAAARAVFEREFTHAAFARRLAERLREPAAADLPTRWRA